MFAVFTADGNKVAEAVTYNLALGIALSRGLQNFTVDVVQCI